LWERGERSLRTITRGDLDVSASWESLDSDEAEDEDSEDDKLGVHCWMFFEVVERRGLCDGCDAESFLKEKENRKRKRRERERGRGERERE